MSKSGADILQSLKGKKQGFCVPDNYFENFEAATSQKKSKAKFLLPKKSGFVVPENYFESTEFHAIDLLKKSAQKSGFKTPENYFENFEVQLPKTKIYSNLLRSRMFQFAAIAASLLILMALGNLLRLDKSSDAQVEISLEELENWFDDNAAVLTSTEIVDTYDDLTLNLTSFNFNGEIADYLAQEDLEDIIIQEEP